VTARDMTSRDARTLELTEAYRATCTAIAPARSAMHACAFVSDARHEAEKAYHATIRAAANARMALLEHASSGAPEIT
jgi:hypothetical protein